jgi:exonuclease III
MESPRNGTGRISRQLTGEFVGRVGNKNRADLYIGSWNVLSLYRAGVLKMLLDQLSNYKPGIVALQEIWWLGNGTLEKQEGTLFYSCDGRIHAFGTGFIVHKQLKHLVIGFKAISPRLSTLRIKGKFFNYSIVNAYAPIEI